MEPLLSHSPEETRSHARALAARLSGGTAILLYGPLGVGKSVFVKGLAEALGINPDEVTSPTFTLIHEYRGTKSLVHVDLYRLEAEGEFEELAVEELLSPETILAIEWADKLPRALKAPTISVMIEDRGKDDRVITIAEEDVDGRRARPIPTDSSALPS